MNSLKLKKGDTVIVISGKDKGKKGKIVTTNAEAGKVVVEGVNIVTKAKKARTAQEKSELVKVEGSIDISNVNVVCPTCGKPVRVKHAIIDGKKVRVCGCGAVLDQKYVKETKKAEKSEAKAEETAKAEKPAKTQKSKTTAKVAKEEKATKTAAAKKPTTSRSAQRGV